EAGPQSVKRKRVAPAPRSIFVALANHALLNSSLLDDLAKLFRRRTRGALRQTRKQKLVITLRRAQRQEIIFERLTDRNYDLALSFALLEANRLNLRKQVDVSPAQIRRVAQARADVKRR